MSRFKRTGGFTLIELMITVVVASVLLSVGLPAFNSFLDRNSLQNTSYELANVLKSARELAVSSGESVQLSLDANGISCVSDGDACEGLDIQNSRLTINDLTGAGAANITFDTAGVASRQANLEIEHQNVQSHTYQLMLRSSGRVTVRMVAEEA